MSKALLQNVCNAKIALKHWIYNNSRSLHTLRGTGNWKKEYSDTKITRFTIEQMYEVVSDVENYHKFVPFCQKSEVYKKDERQLLGKLQIGFPPLTESYVSRVTLQRPYLVKADCTDGKLFHHLTTTWRFAKTTNIGNYSTSGCKVYFYLSFEFKSLLHSQIANLFFDQLVSQMQSAFFKEAHRRFG